MPEIDSSPNSQISFSWKGDDQRSSLTLNQPLFAFSKGVYFNLGAAQRIFGKKLAGLLPNAVLAMFQFKDITFVQTIANLYSVPTAELLLNTALFAAAAPVAPTFSLITGRTLRVTLPALSQYSTSLTLQRSPDNVTFTTLQAGMAAGAIYNDTGLTAATNYWYRCLGVNATSSTAGASGATTTAANSTYTSTYVSDGDTNGVFYFAGQNYLSSGTWANPYGGNIITTVSSEFGAPFDLKIALTDRATSNWVSTNAANSWMDFDLKAGNSLVLNKVNFRNRSTNFSSMITALRVDGSNDNIAFTSLFTVAGLTWATVNEWKAFTVTPTIAYRYIRLTSTAADSGGANYFCAGEVEIYGTLTYV